MEDRCENLSVGVRRFICPLNTFGYFPIDHALTYASVFGCLLICLLNMIVAHDSLSLNIGPLESRWFV